MKQLDTVEYRISEDIEYFGHLEPFKTEGLPTNSIIYKTLPGFGATFWEISYTKRNSIIIEPHVPVIKGKQSKHPEILGVYKGVKQTDIRDYLKNDIYPKKIITTPEGYIAKVKPVIEQLANFSLYNDFFMFFDECDRLITDVKYRGQIIAPIDDFFCFENKAMISATVIMPSDLRFQEQNFTVVKILPDYDYKKDINLVSANNIVEAVRRELAKNSEHPIFIFLNSTLTIYAIIKLLGIEADSKVFCAEDSVTALRLLKFHNTSSDLGGFVKYNFLTSRFFSAVDIDLDYKPDVIMITDVYQASHSILDPMTEVIQISGRFRKKSGSGDKVTVNSLTHITNYNENIKYREPNEAVEYIRHSYLAYTTIIKERDNATTDGAIDSFTQGASHMPIFNFLRADGTLEPFIFDNYIHQQRVKSYYRGVKHLEKAYLDSKYFNVKQELLLHPISDEDNMKLALAKTNKQITEAVAERLIKYTQPSTHTHFMFYDPKEEIDKLKQKYADVVEAFFLIGYEGMKDANFKMSIIRNISNKKKIENARMDNKMVADIQSRISVGDVITENNCHSILSQAYQKFDFKPKKVYPGDLKYYFDVTRTETKNGDKSYRILAKKI